MKWNFWLLIGALVASILGHNIYKFLWNDFYYHGIAVYAVLNSTFNIRALEKWPYDERWLNRCRKAAWILFWASISNLLDEAFFDPGRIQWNEYAAWGVIVVIILFNNKKNAPKR